MKSAFRTLLASLGAAFSLAVAGAPAQAATTIYVDSSAPQYGGFPSVINSAASMGRPDGVSASVPTGGFIAYQVRPFFTTVSFDLEFTGVTGSGLVRLYVGRTNGTGGFSALNSGFFVVNNGANQLASAALGSFCSGLGGCDTYVVQAWAGTTFGVDSILASNPEPSAWALMILGFAGLAARMKRTRRAGPSPSRSPAFA